MVKILPNGDVVQDDDPRLRSNSQNNQARSGGRIRQHHHNDDEHEQGGANNPQVQPGQGQTNIIEVMNQKLIDARFPRWNLGPYVIEPIITVGFLLAFLFFGLPGILFAGLLFAVSKMSQQAGGISAFFRSFFSNDLQSGGNQPNQRQPPRGGGHRLGRN